MTLLQVKAVIALLLAFNVPMATVATVQGILLKSPESSLVGGISRETPDNALVILTNRDRAVNQLPPLHQEQVLMDDAGERAAYLCNHTFEHFNPGDGTNPWQFFKGYVFKNAGENLAKGFSTQEDMEQAWLASPTHRANIMDGRYVDVGVGSACGITVVLFGTRN
jgi:uncharacterized protein YkwD